MTIREDDSYRDNGGTVDGPTELAMTLTLVILGAMTIFSLIAIMLGMSPLAVAGLTATLCTTASTAACRVAFGKRPAQQRNPDADTATSNPL